MKVGLISDVHANLVALEAVMPLLDGLEEIWVMGDTVGYGPEPAKVLHLLRADSRVRMVAGNHDREGATGQGLARFNTAAEEAARMHQQWLDAEDLRFLGAKEATYRDDRDDKDDVDNVETKLPDKREEHGFTLCHGSLADPMWEYVFTPEDAEASFERFEGSWCCGHTHEQKLFRRVDGRTIPVAMRQGVAYEIGERVMLNPGSVGQPRDHDRRSSYAVLDLGAGAVTFYRAAYDVRATQRRMLELGLPEVLAKRLEYGV